VSTAEAIAGAPIVTIIIVALVLYGVHQGGQDAERRRRAERAYRESMALLPSAFLRGAAAGGDEASSVL
jgi:hypothetical protein